MVCSLDPGVRVRAKHWQGPILLRGLYLNRRRVHYGVTMSNAEMDVEDVYHRLEVAEQSIKLLAERLKVAVVEREEYIFLQDLSDNKEYHG